MKAGCTITISQIQRAERNRKQLALPRKRKWLVDVGNDDRGQVCHVEARTRDEAGSKALEGKPHEWWVKSVEFDNVIRR